MYGKGTLGSEFCIVWVGSSILFLPGHPTTTNIQISSGVSFSCDAPGWLGSLSMITDNLFGSIHLYADHLKIDIYLALHI